MVLEIGYLLFIFFWNSPAYILVIIFWIYLLSTYLAKLERAIATLRNTNAQTFMMIWTLVLIFARTVLGIVFAWAYDWVWGLFSNVVLLIGNNYQVDFESDAYIVGENISFGVRYFKNGESPEAQRSKLDSLSITIRRTESISIHDEDTKFIKHFVNLNTNSEGSPEFAMKIIFSVKKSGEYKISILDNGKPIYQSPFIKCISPGKLDPEKTELLRPGPIVLLTTFDHKTLWVKGRDKFDNQCEIFPDDMDKLSCTVNHADGRELTSVDGPTPTVQFSKKKNSIALSLSILQPGFYTGSVKYDDLTIQHGTFEIVVLTFGERARMDHILANEPSWKYHEAKLLALGNETKRGSTVYIYVSPKQLYVRDYLLKFIPLRVATFRVSPITKIDYLFPDHARKTYTLGISDGIQPKVILEMDETSARTVISMFAHFLQRRLGGTESFVAKQTYFYDELKHVRKDLRISLTLIKISRESLIESTMQKTKHFDSKDWCKNFKVEFEGEPGMDAGGPKREWLDLCCSKLFANSPTGLFSSIGTSRLVHPNPESKRNSKLSLKYYELAGKIVGKCVYESAMGGCYKQMVNGRFTRSFLAQVIGLRPNYKHFEQDDPELYLSKVKFILENDVTDMELTFTDEIYSRTGKLIKTVELISNGSKLAVTNENKEEYLNCLANYRLATTVTKEVEAFVRGLNAIIPDELLINFDENELEVLWCGKSEFNLEDLQRNYIRGNWDIDHGYNRVLEWFWIVIGGLSDEEKARLLQFTTGSSLLPHGGFKDLSPKFKITLSSDYGKLPTAHTCFNEIILSDHNDFENFQKCVKVAINEGSEGFSFR